MLREKTSANEIGERSTSEVDVYYSRYVSRAEDILFGKLGKKKKVEKKLEKKVKEKSK